MKKINNKEDLAEGNIYHIQNNDYYHKKSFFIFMFDLFVLTLSSSF